MGNRWSLAHFTLGQGERRNRSYVR